MNLSRVRIAITDSTICTTLPTGHEVLGVRHDTPEYAETARRLGYGTDVARMNITHEVTHSLLAWLLGLDASPTFRRLAYGEFGANRLTEIEEAAVTSVEIYANLMGVDLVARARSVGK